METDTERAETFLALSTTVTGFSPYELRGTGQAESYLETLDRLVGKQIVNEALAAFADVAREAGTESAALARGLRRHVFSDEKLGPVVRRLVKLWYVGTWYELPHNWQESYGENNLDRTFVVSASSYTEGLLWPAIGANPPGAKPPGYGSWANPPRIEA
jgi:hypothetical protein